MDRRPQSLLRRIMPGIALGFVVVLVVLFVADVRKVSAVFFNFRWSLFPLILALTLCNYLFRFLKWHYYAGIVSERKIPLMTNAKLFIGGLPLAVTPGNVGEALKGIWLNRESGMPVASGISVVMAERISDGLSVLLLSTLGVIAYPRYWPVFATSLAFLLVVIIISQIRPLALMLLTWGERVPLLKRFVGPLHEFYESSHALLQPRATLTGVLLGTISWLGEGAGMYVVLRGLGLAPSWETFSTAVFIFSFSAVVGGISTLPGGLGAAEASLAGMLIFILGLKGELASAGALLIRFGTLWFGVSLGLLVWVFSPELLQIAEDA